MCFQELFGGILPYADCQTMPQLTARRAVGFGGFVGGKDRQTIGAEVYVPIFHAFLGGVYHTKQDQLDLGGDSPAATNSCATNIAGITPKDVASGENGP